MFDHKASLASHKYHIYIEDLYEMTATKYI